MPKVLRATKMEQCIACMGCMLTCARVRHGSLSVERSAIRIRTAGGFQSQMLADICMGCENPPCADGCMSGALKPRAGGGVLFDRDACFACKKCIEACPVSAIVFDEDLHAPIICIQCAACVRHCPHHCLSMEEVIHFDDIETTGDLPEPGDRKNAG